MDCHPVPLTWPPRSGRVLVRRPRRLSALIVGIVSLTVGYLVGHATCDTPRSGVEPALFDAVERAERCKLALAWAEQDRLDALDALATYRARVDGGVVRTLAVLADNPWVCGRAAALRLPRAPVPPLPQAELAIGTDSL